jgi:C-terminal processing protease CtpA/Prc
MVTETRTAIGGIESMTRTQLIILLAGIGTGLLLSAITSEAQTMKMVTVGGGDVDGTCMIGELGALIFEKDSTLTVEHVMTPEQRPTAYRDVDLQIDDVILMVNGKRVRTADGFNAILGGMSAGDKVQLGVRRDKNMQIVSFAKAAPEDLPQIKMVTKALGDTEGTGKEGGEGMKTMTQTSGGPGSSDNLVIIGGSGLIAREDSAGVVILLALPKAAELLDSATVEGGDRIVKLQGKDVKDLKTFRTALDAIEVGAKVNLVLSHDDEEYSVSFAKAEPENLMIKKK